jgi:hypothetical protein
VKSARPAGAASLASHHAPDESSRRTTRRNRVLDVTSKANDPTRAASAQDADVAAADVAPGDREQVAIKAFEIYCARGCEDGHDLEDWIEAERQIRKGTAGGPPGAVSAAKR